MQKKKLTVKSIDAIVPGAKDIIMFDSEIAGFQMKVTPRGKRGFFLFYRTVDHTQRKPLIGHYPTMKPEIARGIALNWSAEVRSGGDPSADRKARRVGRGQGTVAQMLEDFLKAKSKLRSICEIERIFRKDILPQIGSRRTEDVKRSDITEMLDKIHKRAPVLAVQVRAHISSFYSWAMPKLPDTAINPVIGALKIPTPKPRRRVLTEDEIKALWTVIGTENDTWRLALRFMILTGQRRTEVLKADWSEVNLTRAEWVIPAERAKNDKTHIVPLAPAAVELLSIIPHRTGRLFLAAGQISRPAKRIRTKLAESMSVPIEPWVWHDIRRTVATSMQRLGVRVEVTEATLNHVSGSKAGIAGVYQLHDWADEKREALEKWSQELERIVGRALTI